jgi:hypothetical protein
MAEIRAMGRPETAPSDHDGKARDFMAQYGFGDSYARDDLANLLRAAHASGEREATAHGAEAVAILRAIVAATGDIIDEGVAAGDEWAIRQRKWADSDGNPKEST